MRGILIILGLVVFQISSMAQEKAALPLKDQKTTSVVTHQEVVQKMPILKDGPYHITHNQTHKSIEILMENAFDVLVFTLTNKDGKQVKAKGTKKDNLYILPMEHLPDGKYTLRLKSANKMYLTQVYHSR